MSKFKKIMSSIGNGIIETFHWRNFVFDSYYVAFVLIMLRLYNTSIYISDLYLLLIILSKTYVQVTTNKTVDEPAETKPTEKLILQFKTSNDEVVNVPITVESNNTPIKKEYGYELLFRERDSIVIKAFDEKDAIEKAKLSVTDTADLMGVEKL